MSFTRKSLAWALYDWANSAFPTVVSTFVIAAWFTQGIAASPAEGQAQWGLMQSLAALAIALLSPFLGAVADAGGRRRLMLLVCTLITALATGLLWFATPDTGSVLWALGCVGIATLGFELGTVFYNAMLPDVAPPGRLGRLSGLAWGLGYAGGLCCLLLCLGLVLPDPAPFGLDRATAEPVRATALLVAGWMLLFGWPVLVALPDPAPPRPAWGAAARAGLAELLGLLRRLPRHPVMARFLIARLFYTDGLNTLFAFGAIYAAGVFGMGMQDILLFGVALNVTAGLGAAGFGLMEDRLGARQTVLLSLGAILGLGTALVLVQSLALFWVLALCLGLFLGPAQAASRSYMAQLAPAGEAAAHFGLFALSGRITGFAGPALLAAITAATDSQRAGMASVLGFILVGGVLLLGIKGRK